LHGFALPRCLNEVVNDLAEADAQLVVYQSAVCVEAAVGGTDSLRLAPGEQAHLSLQARAAG